MAFKTEEEILKYIDEVNESGEFKPNWDSLSKMNLPAWFSEEKLGIFIHWGIYSVPAHNNEWYSRNMYIQSMEEWEHHRKTYGDHKNFGYKDFIPMLTAEKFDPDEWITLFKNAGAGYVFPVAEHHDGFQMYKSELSKFNAVNMGPKKDILGLLKEAAEKQDVTFCTSSHRAEHWFFMGHGKEFDSDIKDPMVKGDFYWPAMPEPDNEDLFSKPYPTNEYLNDWLARTAEIIINYQPKLLYFDWWIQHQAFKPYLQRLAAFYYNMGKKWGVDVAICYKHDAMAFGSGIVEVERGGFAQAKPFKWQTDTAVAHNSWCYTDSLDYKTPRDIIVNLIDVVSKNGNLLLNIGPKADGTIPEGDKHILEELAKWMKVNGEAIRGARMWRKTMEGDGNCEEGQFQDAASVKFESSDYRFTANNGKIYAICMKCPEDGTFLIKSLANSSNQNKPDFHGIIEKVDILGYDGEINWSVDGEGLKIQSDCKSEYPVVIAVTVE